MEVQSGMDDGIGVAKQSNMDTAVLEIEAALERESTASGDASSGGTLTPTTPVDEDIDDMWQVVCASDKGVIVREGKNFSSPLVNERLVKGALVRSLNCEEGRMHYELVAGTGPSSGWVSVVTQDGKELLTKFVAPVTAEDSAHILLDDGTDAMNRYGERLSAAKLNVKVSKIVSNGTGTKFLPKLGSIRPDGEIVEAQQGSLYEGLDVAVDSDGEEFELCCRCGLPVGEIGYPDEEKCESLLHGECLAHLETKKMKMAEEARMQKEAKLKSDHREDYDIGWAPATLIPRNVVAAEKLGCGFVPKGMVCLMLDGDRSVRIAPTSEPGAAVNLEYLSIALQVRQREGKEPLFSLDPVNSHGPLIKTDDPKEWMQKKRFEPAWLAGTSAGELLFQADYNLKELSMGACEQPVVGMKSVFDFIEHESVFESEWVAREWFVIRKAEMRVSDDNVLVPFCKMGVEAREQVWGPNGMEDALISSPDHPLVRYAEEFTRNFDLIAERKSSIYHLREMAKASVLAKFLMEKNFHLDDAWFNLATNRFSESSLEVPCLWNDRAHSRVRVQNGKLLNGQQGLRPLFNHVFGGVSLDMSQFPLDELRPSAATVKAVQMAVPGAAGVPGAAPPPPPAIVSGFAARISAPVAALGVPTLTAPVRAGAAQFASRAAVPSMALAPGGLEGRPSPEAQGVDLNLDSFDLTTTHNALQESSKASWGADMGMASAFWSSLTSSDSVLNEDDKKLLTDIFNPNLSDRRAEGELFVPPDTSFSHVRKLCALTKQEDVVRAFRKELFLSDRFDVNEPGQMFPVSWAPSHEIAHGQQATAKQTGKLVARPDFESLVGMFDLKSSAPVFFKTSEDGMKFRMYKFGSLEVRTTEEHEGEETIGMVFSTRSTSGGKVDPQEIVLKATLYVALAQSERKFVQEQFYLRHFAVLDTVQGNAVVMERLGNGELLFEENPVDLQDRKSLAKFLRCVHSKKVVTIAEMRSYEPLLPARRALRQPTLPASHVSRSACKRYAQGVCDRVGKGAVNAPARETKNTQFSHVSFTAFEDAAPGVVEVKAPRKAFELRGPK